MSDIVVERLDNGLVVAFERIEGMATASMCWLIPAGTAGDPEGAAGEGEASVLSEMILRGAGALDSRQYSDALDALGCERRTTANPFHVLMTATALGSKLADALPLLTDAVLRPRLEADHLDPVRRLALQALEGLTDDPQHLVMLRLGLRFLPPPYNRTGYGHADGLNRLTIEGLRQTWKRRAVPGGSIMSFAGAVDAKALLPLLKSLFKDWKGSTSEPDQTGAPARGVDHMELPTSQTHLAIALPAPVDSHADATALRLARWCLAVNQAADCSPKCARSAACATAWAAAFRWAVIGACCRSTPAARRSAQVRRWPASGASWSASPRASRRRNSTVPAPA